MSIDILNMRQFDKNDSAIDIALPVMAIECEATPPVESYLDAYEEAVLKFIYNGMGPGVIAKAMQTTYSVVSEVLSRLESGSYVEKKHGEPWKIAKKGADYLLCGKREEQASEHTQYGIMFVNVIKKEVLPFFYEGDINQISSFGGKGLPFKLTVGGDEQKTFNQIDVNRMAMQTAFRKFCRNRKAIHEYREDEKSYEEVAVLFDGLEDFDEAEDESFTEEVDEPAQKPLFVKPLKVAQKEKYLRMRIIIDLSVPGGYRVESPFMMSGCDTVFFLRQIQWLTASQSVYIGSENMTSFFEREIRKISPSYKLSEKDFDVWALEKIPLLRIYRNQFSRIYDDMARIYTLMQNQHSLLDKEHIVNDISRYVVESLLNKFFKGIDSETLEIISDKAQKDLKNNDIQVYIQSILKKTELKTQKISWGWKFLNDAVGRMKTTKGNSIIEKFINIVVMNYYLGTTESKKFLNNKDIQSLYDIADKLNQIRRKVSHDTNDRLDDRDYQYYISNVFRLTKGLLESIGRKNDG